MFTVAGHSARMKPEVSSFFRTCATLHCLPGAVAGSSSEVEQPGLGLVPVWGAGVVGGSFVCYTTTLSPKINSLDFIRVIMNILGCSFCLTV